MRVYNHNGESTRAVATESELDDIDVAFNKVLSQIRKMAKSEASEAIKVLTKAHSRNDDHAIREKCKKRLQFDKAKMIDLS